MIGRWLSWIGGIVMGLIDRRASGVKLPDVNKDQEWERAKEKTSADHNNKN